MKAISYVLAILLAGGAAYFSLEHWKKFEELQKVRIETREENKRISADADVKEKELKDERKALADAKDRRESITQKLAMSRSTGSQLKREVADLDNKLEDQKTQFVELDKAMEQVRSILKELATEMGGEITLDNLPAKIEQIQQDVKSRQASLDELTTQIEKAEKILAATRAELDRNVKRDMDRSARIGRNSMQSVITAVNQDWGFLVIGAGSNSGFTPQTSLIVQRDGRLIGRVRPSSIEPTQTIAEIDYKSLAAGVRLQPGDKVILEEPLTN